MVEGLSHRSWPLACFGAALLVAASAFPVTAQEANGRRLTLDEALTLAEKSSERVAIAAAGVSRADAGRALARSQGLPQLDAGVSYDRTLKSEFEGLFDEGSSGGNGGGDGGGDGVDFSNLPFGQANVVRAGLSFNQLLYAGGRVRAERRQAALRHDSAVLNLASAGAQNTLDVSEAYYDAALTDRLVAIARETYAQADRSLKVTEDQRAAGRLSEFELLRARVARDSLQPSVVRAQNNREVAYLRLKQLLDLPLSEPLTLTAELDQPVLPPPPRFAERLAAAEAQAEGQPPTYQSFRVALAQVGNEVKIAEQAVTVAKSEGRPNIGFRSDYGLVDYPTKASDFEDWRQNWTVGIGLTVPVFNGGRIRANRRIAEANVEESKATLRLSEELAALDLASTRSDLAAARSEWETSLATIEQAQRAYEIAELRYREGLSTQLELSDARLQLAQSLVTRAQAARNLQVGRIRYALLPELPLAGVSASAVQSAAGTPAPVQPRSQLVPVSPGTVGIAGNSGGR
jgi:outer membrane protein TolC